MGRKTYTEHDYTHYEYISCTGEVINLRVGQDGVTEEYIQELQKLDAADSASHMKFKRYRKENGKYKPTVVSLDAMIDKGDGESEYLTDPKAFTEAAYINKEKDAAYKAKFGEAWSGLSDNQRQLFINVYVKRIPKNQIAADEGVDPTAIRNRLVRIVKRLKNIS